MSHLLAFARLQKKALVPWKCSLRADDCRHTATINRQLSID